MEKKKSSYTIIALLKLLDGEKISSIPPAKNSNQYFNKIKHQGIELLEKELPHSKVLNRSLKMTPENIKRAKKYLHQLQGKA